MEQRNQPKPNPSKSLNKNYQNPQEDKSDNKNNSNLTVNNNHLNNKIHMASLT